MSDSDKAPLGQRLTGLALAIGAVIVVGILAVAFS